MATTATTDLVGWQPTLIRTAAYDTTLEPRNALSSWATTFPDLEGVPGASAVIPTIGPTTPADNLAETVAAVDDKLSGAGVTVTIKEAVKSIAVFDRAKVQSIGDPDRIMGQRVGEALNDRIELDLGAAVVAGRLTAADVAVTTTLTPASFRALRAKMPAQLRNRGRGAVLFAPGSVLEGLYADPLFANAATWGSREGLLEGAITRYLGINIVEVDESVLPAITVTNLTAALIADGVLLRGIQRGVQIEPERDARARLTRMVGTIFHGEGVVDSRGIVCANIDVTP